MIIIIPKSSQKIKNRNFFLDEDPKYFRVVLNFLRQDKVTLDEPKLFNGVFDLAKNLELNALVDELVHRARGWEYQ